MTPVVEQEFLSNLALATRRAVNRCASELAVMPTVNVAPVKDALVRRVTFLVPGPTRKTRPTILFMCLATARTLRRPRMTGDGYFGNIADVVRRGGA